MTQLSDLSPPNDILQEIPLPSDLEQRITIYRETAEQIYLRKDSRMLAVVGPCSVHDLHSTLHYASRLKKLAERVKDTMFIVMRVYIEKPRTTIGWKGLLYDPFLNGTNDIEQGIRMSRSLLREVNDMGIPVAVEFLDPLVSLYLSDLVTWGFIGARTSASQIHRQMVSSLPIPIGFKNSLDGDLEMPLHGIISSRTSHDFITITGEGKVAVAHSPGNLYTHLVLRGFKNGANYDLSSVKHAAKLQASKGIHSPILIDCSHDNSKKLPALQEISFRNVVRQFASSQESLLGIMMESFLKEGNQCLDPGGQIDPDLSITDACLSWESTEKLLLWADATLKEAMACSSCS